METAFVFTGHAGIVFTQWSKNGLRCPDKREIWHGGADPWTKGPLPRAKFHVYRGRNVGIQPPKLSKFRILAINLPFSGH